MNRREFSKTILALAAGASLPDTPVTATAIKQNREYAQGDNIEVDIRWIFIGKTTKTFFYIRYPKNYVIQPGDKLHTPDLIITAKSLSFKDAMKSIQEEFPNRLLNVTVYHGNTFSMMKNGQWIAINISKRLLKGVL